MIDIRAAYSERVAEIDEFLFLVEAVEKGVQQGVPLVGTRETKISVTQQRVLNSTVYLHLYNLVEATITRCILAVEDAASAGLKWKAGDLSTEMRKEWVRTLARTHVPLNPENRLESAVAMCDHLVQMLPVKVEIDKDGGGNWDDELIFDFSKRLGMRLRISTNASEAAKKNIRDNMGPLKLVKYLRNKLAHGEMSFGECGEDVTFSHLKTIRENVTCYLDEVISNFEQFIADQRYLNNSQVSIAGVTSLNAAAN